MSSTSESSDSELENVLSDIKEKKMTKKEKKKARNLLWEQLDDDDIKKPNSKKEKELMSIVFGGKSNLISNLEESSSANKTKRNDKQNKDKAPAWRDSDDEAEETPAKIQKTNNATDVTKPRPNQRKNFEKIMGNPAWADLDKQKEEDSDDEILRTVGHIVKSQSSNLQKEMIEIKKLKDLNRTTRNEGLIRNIIFHPTSTVAIVCGNLGVTTIFAVDGNKNEKLHSLGFERFPTKCCGLSPDGSELVFGANRGYMHLYHLLSGVKKTIVLKKDAMKRIRSLELSPCGRFIATIGEFGEIHIIDAKSKEYLHTLQQRHKCSSLAFTPDSKLLFCHSKDVEVTVYDLETMRVIHIFTDDGCVNGSFIAVSSNGQYIATGSKQGIANIYSKETVLREKFPKAEKTIMNMTTAITGMAFNSTSELLAIVSKKVENGVKLIHVASGTVFRNFPHQNATLGQVTAFAFSPGSGYMAIGNNFNRVSLFRLKHFQNY